MRNNRRGVGEDFAARNMVAVVMAVDQVADQLVEALLDLALEPCLGVGVDLIGDNGTVGCDQKIRNMDIVLQAVEIARDLCDRAFWRVLRVCRGD